MKNHPDHPQAYCSCPYWQGLLVLLLLLSPVVGWGQNFNATYTFANVTTNSGTTDPTPVPTATGVSFGAFSVQGSGFTNPNATIRFSFVGWPLDPATVGDLDGTPDFTKYYQVTITPVAGTALDLTAITFSVQRANTGIRQFAVRSSLDAYAANLPASISSSNSNLSVVGSNVLQIADVSGNQDGSTITLGSDFANIITAVTFRIYGWNAEAGAGPFSIDNVAITGSSRDITPTVTSLNPASGLVGTSVTITGSNLTGATSVLFNGTPAIFTVDNSTQITATVPVGATTGNVTVTTPGGVATGPIFDVILTPTIIGGLTPGSGPAGTVVAVEGTGFFTGLLINLGSTAVAANVISSTQLTFTIPASTPLGALNVSLGLGLNITIGTFQVTAPLPVELVSFEAARQGEAVRVAWATATEKNNAFFEVQRSATGKEFSSVARVEGTGNNSRLQTYLFLDRQPLAGTSYYRLRQVDTDGTASFSPVVAVAPSKELMLYPNPTRGELHLQMATGAAHYRVLNLLGRVVLEGQAPTGSTTLDLVALPAGLYQLELTSAAGREVRKFVKE